MVGGSTFPRSKFESPSIMLLGDVRIAFELNSTIQLKILIEFLIILILKMFVNTSRIFMNNTD